MFKVVFLAAVGIIALANAASLRVNDTASMPGASSSAISVEDCAKLGIRSPVTGQCFVYVKVSKSFLQAEAFCQTVYHGHLASLHNAFDNLVVAAYGRQTFGPVNQFYIGLNSLTSTNSTWQDGTPVDYTNFVDNNNNTVAKCTTVDVKTGNWIKTDCFRTLVYFVCSF